jgi:hypothetical protein
LSHYKSAFSGLVFWLKPNSDEFGLPSDQLKSCPLQSEKQQESKAKCEPSQIEPMSVVEPKQQECKFGQKSCGKNTKKAKLVRNHVAKTARMQIWSEIKSQKQQESKFGQKSCRKKANLVRNHVAKTARMQIWSEIMCKNSKKANLVRNHVAKTARKQIWSEIMSQKQQESELWSEIMWQKQQESKFGKKS